ncbi:hypothetical protein D3C87_1814540 [compost metagenome]
MITICQLLTDFIAWVLALYRSILLIHLRGNFAVRNSEKGVENLTMNGVVKVVTAETATTMGYKKLLVSFSVIPSEAMIKENSPICDKLIPV